jgi:hypothetical protein
MGDIEISDNPGLDADLASEQPSDRILSQLALAAIMLALEVDLRAYVRALNAAEAHSASIEQASYGPFARLLRRFAAPCFMAVDQSPIAAEPGIVGTACGPNTPVKPAPGFEVLPSEPERSTMQRRRHPQPVFPL